MKLSEKHCLNYILNPLVLGLRQLNEKGNTIQRSYKSDFDVSMWNKK